MVYFLMKNGLKPVPIHVDVKILNNLRKELNSLTS